MCWDREGHFLYISKNILDRGTYSYLLSEIRKTGYTFNNILYCFKSSSVSYLFRLNICYIVLKELILEAFYKELVTEGLLRPGPNI